MSRRLEPRARGKSRGSARRARPEFARRPARRPEASRRSRLARNVAGSSPPRFPPFRIARRVLGVLGFVLVIALGTSLFFSSSAFGVQEVVIIGSTHLGSDEIVSLCGVERGTNILKVSTKAIRARLLANPRIEEARVSRRLPSRILVTVTEREGVALLQCHGLYAELDQTGLPVGLHRFMTASGLPIITGIEVSGLTLGTRLEDPRLSGPLSCAAALGMAGRAAVAEVHLDETGELVLYTRDGIPVFVGDSSGLEAKVTALLGILGDVRDNDLEVHYVDVRYPRFPAVGSPGGPVEPVGWMDPDVFPAIEP